MSLYEELTWRNLIHQMTHPELAEKIDRDRFTVYCGFDPTADSLHIGSLLPILGLMRFQRAGHKPIAVVGGATGMIGDPKKTEERALLSDDDIERNLAGIRAQLERFLDFSGSNAAAVLNNADWFRAIGYIPFLRDIGKHFSVNQMLMRDAVKQRLEGRDHGISYTEFSYVLLQAYDFLHLYRTHGCRLQIGGSDQWGNIVAGMDLTRRLEQAETFGLTFPLVEKADGEKFGKTESGTVWLDARRTSPYKFYQFWINQADADMPRWLRSFTFLTQEEVVALETELRDRPDQRAAQKRLAEEVTHMVHGRQALENAIHASQAMFGGSLAGLDDATLEDVFSEVPSTELPRASLAGDRLLVEVLVECGVFKSKGEARRLVQSGGVYLNNERVAADDAKLTDAALVGTRIAVVRTGKKNYHLLKFTLA
ncbi:MAG: tyrosine--tRNA ligase [Candidatus Hydrogenedentes bacterium]|nr:tyrosine--tRNA ligase [Candidatus Hydrogenedentota bacterium]